MMRSSLPVIFAALLLTATGCDNVVGVYGGGGTGAGSTNVQVMPAGGIVADARPRVVAAVPSGSAIAASTPVVVSFSESVNRDTVEVAAQLPGVPGPGSGPTTGGVQLVDADSGQPVPVTYEFLLGDTVVLLRPVTALPVDTAYEVLVDPSVRDVDGVTYGGTEPDPVASFFVDQDPADEDGRIVEVLPRDAAVDQSRETPVFVVFDKAPDGDSALAGTELRDAFGTVVSGDATFPFTNGVDPDTRVLRFDPDSALEGARDYELFVDSSILFGAGGVLQFGGRRPFSRFSTLAHLAPQSVSVGNFTAGFEHRVNRANLDNLAVDVVLDPSARADDRLVGRIYGLDSDTEDPDDVAFVERDATLTADGAQTVTLDFAGALGTLAQPRFDDGPLTLAVELVRGRRSSGFVTSAGGNPTLQDTVLPTVVGAGAPAGGVAQLDLFSDQESAVFYGLASERLGEATLTANGAMVPMFAANDAGQFVMTPIDLGRNVLALDYTLSITDAAGNLAASAVTGRIVPRGVMRGSVAGGSLTVEAYDAVTMAAVPGAVVIVEPGLPMAPAVGQRTATTAANGRASFTGLSAASHTMTVVAPGYDVRTLLDSGSAFVSLPLRPIGGGTATLDGAVAFAASVGDTALIGCNLIDDPTQQALATSAGQPTAIPSTAIRANRLAVVNAFAGRFEPMSLPTFAHHACQLCGPDGLTPTMPLGPVDSGATASAALALLPATLTTLNLAAPYTVDFGTATGLDLANLLEPPVVRLMGSLAGFGGTSLFGVGFATGAGGGVYDVNATYSLTTALNLTPFTPLLMVSTEAVDQSGNLSRHRRLVDVQTGQTVPTLPPIGIPSVTAPSSSSGEPAITYQDRLDPTALGQLLGWQELTVTDAGGRRWSLWRLDEDGALGARTVQLPQLPAPLTGLVAGAWSVVGEAHVFFSTRMSAQALVFEEVRRGQVAYARGSAISVSVSLP